MGDGQGPGPTISRANRIDTTQVVFGQEWTWFTVAFPDRAYPPWLFSEPGGVSIRLDACVFIRKEDDNGRPVATVALRRTLATELRDTILVG